ncbi:MAG: TonB family protein, partial [Pigmentiphaga sp.]
RKLREAFQSAATRAAGIGGGTASRSQAGDGGYGAMVRSCVQPGVIYPANRDSVSGNPYSIYRVQLDGNGRQLGKPQLLRSSGVSAFDRAVLTGIQRCDPFPRPPSGRFPSTIDVRYNMFD